MRRSFLSSLRALLRLPPRGSSLIEFALVLPVLVLVLTALVDFGLGFYKGLQVQGAAAAGAHYATLHRWDIAAIAAEVSGAGGGIKAIPAPVQVCGCPTGTTGSPENDLSVVAFPAPGSGPTTLGNCSGSGVPTCGGCATSAGASCPAGLYAFVSARAAFSPILFYPALPLSIDLSGHAYRRLK